MWQLESITEWGDDLSRFQAIDTYYNGYKFRSRLEARWAVFFDALGVKYEYEPDGFKLPSGKCYLPDFRIKCYGTRGQNYADYKSWNPCQYCKHSTNHSEKPCELFELEKIPLPEWLEAIQRGIFVTKCEKSEPLEPFDLYVEVKGRMTQADADKIHEFAGHWEEYENGTYKSSMWVSDNPILIVGEIPNPDKYNADSDLGNYQQMDGINIYPWNYETIDGDHFAAYPAVDRHGHFYLDGDDGNYQTMDTDIIRHAFRKARQARFEHGETPTTERI